MLFVLGLFAVTIAVPLSGVALIRVGRNRWVKGAGWLLAVAGGGYL